MAFDSFTFREIVLNVRQPLVIRNFKHNWKCFQGSLDEWCNKLDADEIEPIEFEVMSRCCGYTQQWERKRTLRKMTGAQFLQYETGDYWAALNYKRLHELPEECRDDIDLSCFGFAKAAEDCSFWLSTRNANTPCHYDTYGCNVVVQIYGKKSWLLFSPDAPLTKSRIPYEESSVYCLENFYAPQEEMISDLVKLQNYAYMYTLEPNDVLIVPRHWWHYVETVETSLSVNYWVPLEIDVDVQLEECIVKFLIESIVKSSEETAIAKYLLNPNQLEQIADDAEIFSILEYLINGVQSKHSGSQSNKYVNKGFKYQYLENEDLNKLKHKILNAFDIPKATKNNLQKLLQNNSKRFDKNLKDHSTSPINIVKENLINSICQPIVVEKIKTEFMRIYERSKLFKK